MYFIRFWLFISVFSFFAVACSSQIITENKNTAQTIEALQIQLEDVLKEMHVPGMSIAIVRRDGPEWIAALGKADLDNDRQATAATLFRIGSISKGFVSLAILMLVEEGKLSLEDPLQKLAPEVWFGNQWENSNPVRLVHLLENTTGWDEMHLSEFAKDPGTMSFFDRLDYRHTSRISRWCPGTRMSYCNSGFAVAAYIVEKIVGRTFEEYIDQYFFKPIGMQTATYLQPTSELSTVLYHSDGKTSLPYWNILYPSIGSINASANDMANYLLFYLNRGNIHGKQIISATLFNRIEFPSSTWAAQEGLRLGYGLSNYSTIHDGFVYHGHNGVIPGGLTTLAYLPNEGIGYFYSLNSGNRKAFKKVGQIVRAYITSRLQKPPIPQVASLSENTILYSGWYEPDSPRIELLSFLERLIGMSYIHFEDNKLIINSLSEKSTFLPVTDHQFRYIPVNESQDAEPTLMLLEPNNEGKFIQLNLGLRSASLNVTLKHIPTWFAMFKIIIVAFVLLAFLSILIYAPFWIFQALIKKNCHHSELYIRLWPLVAVLSLISIVVICMLTNMDADGIWRLGNLTVWSFPLFLATIVFACSSIASVIALLKACKGNVRSTIRIFSTMTAIALLIATTYLAYWGIIGLRTWA